MLRGQYGHSLPSTCRLPATQAISFRHGRIVRELKSGMLMRSGSCGPWPRSPQANPAKPAPSLAIVSTWVAGTSLAFGAPVISTKEQKKYLIPLSFTSDFTSSIIFPAPPCSRRNCRRSFLAYQLAGAETGWRERLDQLRSLARGDQFGCAFGGNRGGFESVGAPPH